MLVVEVGATNRPVVSENDYGRAFGGAASISYDPNGLLNVGNTLLEAEDVSFLRKGFCSGTSFFS